MICIDTLEVPTFCPANVNDDGAAVTPLVPLPARGTIFGEAVESLRMTSEPARAPATCGRIASECVQLAPGASDDPHVVLLATKSPVTFVAEKVTGMSWLFLSVSVVVLENPSTVEATVAVLAESEMGNTLLPVRLTDCEAIAAS